jgi:flagellar protein FlaI
MGESVVMTDIMTRRGWDKARLKQELADRIKVLGYLHLKGIRDYRKVTVAINAYYVMPARVLEMIDRDELEQMIEADAGR